MYPSLSLALICLALAAPAASFTAVSPTGATSRPSLPILRSTEDGSESSTTPASIRALVAASAIGVGLLFPAAGALAVLDTAALQHVSPNEHMLQSSLTLSVEIKTMDFALPSSYDNIADPVASGTEELTKTVNVNTGKTTAKKKSAEAAPKKEKKQPSDQAERKEASAAALAERVAQRKAKEAEDAVKEAERAAEVQERIKQARLEKIAAREAAKEEKAAAEAAAADEARLKGAKFVDTSMPSY